MWTPVDLIGEASSYLAERLSSTSAGVGVSPFEQIRWCESVPVPEIHRVRVGDRVLLGFSVLVVPATTRPSAQVVLGGELCPATAPALHQHLEALVQQGVVCIHIDLSQLRLCTAAGVEVLESIRAELAHRGGGLWTQGATGVVARVFEILDVRQERPLQCFGGVDVADAAPHDQCSVGTDTAVDMP